MTDASATLVRELEALGLERREARWIVDEFAPAGDALFATAVRHAAERRRAGEPLQYILGHWPFRTLDLDVDPRVLIPRPETEELVGVVLRELARSSSATPLIVDLGCGSGAIGLALHSELDDRGVRATVVAVDVSLDALAVARRNALKHQLLRTSFVHSNWFDELDPSLRTHVDVITANPPYVGEGEMTFLDPVLTFEPRGALVSADFDGVVGFADVASIISAAGEWLAPGGLIVCEHGTDHGSAAQEAARHAGLVDVRGERDMAGHDRFLIARQPT